MKPGDVVWIKVSWVPERYMTAIPDHPALPAVARVLVDSPFIASDLWSALDVYSSSRSAECDVEERLKALLAALSQEDSDGR